MRAESERTSCERRATPSNTAHQQYGVLRGVHANHRPRGRVRTECGPCGSPAGVAAIEAAIAARSRACRPSDAMAAGAAQKGRVQRRKQQL
jgi:hypothetical protein